MKKILITGAAGFVGYHLALYLSRKGRQVILMDQDDRFARISLGSYDPSSMEFISRDLAVSPLELPSDVEYIIHLAAMPHVDFSFLHPALVYQNNVMSTQNILRAAAECGVPVIIGSSVEVYGGEPGRIYTEDDGYCPMSPYAASKAACEVMGHTYARCYGLRAKFIRFTNLYGPWQLPDRIIPRNMGRMLDQLPLDIQGYAVRDFLFIEDALKAIEAVMEAGIYGETYNISTGQGTTMQEIGRLLSGMFDYPPPAQLFDQEPTNSRGSSLVINSDKLRRHTGWQPETYLDEGLLLTYEWCKRHEGWVRQFRPQYEAVREGSGFIADFARISAPGVYSYAK